MVNSGQIFLCRAQANRAQADRAPSLCLEKCFTSFLCYLIICDFFPGMTCDKANKQPDIIHHLSEQQEIELVAMFQQEWWTKGRTAEDTSRMLKHSYVVAMQDPESKKLIAFGRCVSDQVLSFCIWQSKHCSWSCWHPSSHVCFDICRSTKLSCR